jgi:hypothetical protein
MSWAPDGFRTPRQTGRQTVGHDIIYKSGLREQKYVSPVVLEVVRDEEGTQCLGV